MGNQETSICGICPARGGSKGLPEKHEKKLGDMPMIAHTIRSARESSMLTDFIVNTENKEIKEIAERYRAKVVERPPELAEDETPVIDVLNHLLDQLELKGEKPDLIVLLQATSPLRTGEDIDNAIEKFLESGGNSLVSVTKSRIPPYWHFTVEEDFLSPLITKEEFNKHRQEFSNSFQLNGAIYIISTETFRREQGFFTEKTIPYEMPPERSVDVDDELDFWLAEAILKQKKRAETTGKEDPSQEEQPG